MYAQTGGLHLDLSEKNQTFALQTVLQTEPVHRKQRQVGDLLQNLATGLFQHIHVEVVYGQLQFL